MATKQQQRLRETCNWCVKKMNERLETQITKGKKLGRVLDWLQEICVDLDTELTMRASKATTEDRLFWLAVRVTGAWLHTVDQEKIPDEMALLLQHILLAFLDDPWTRGTVDRKLLEDCYDHIGDYMPEAQPSLRQQPQMERRAKQQQAKQAG